MKLPKTMVEGAVSSEITRYQLNFVRYDVEKKRLLASDGKILACVPVEPSEGDVSGPVDPEHFKEGRKRAKKFPEPEMKVNGKIEYPDGATAPPDKIEQTFPDADAVIDPLRKRAHTVQVVLDLNLLMKLAKAVATERYGSLEIKLSIGNKNDPILVEPLNLTENKACGVIMPLAKVQF